MCIYMYIYTYIHIQQIAKIMAQNITYKHIKTIVSLYYSHFKGQ